MVDNMNQNIDPNLNIFWSVNLKSEKTWFDKINQDGAEWFKLIKNEDLS